MPSASRKRVPILATALAIFLLAGSVPVLIFVAIVYRKSPAGPADPPAGEKLVRPAAAAQGFVGSKVCGECHAEIAERYESHPMAHSLNLVAQAAPLEDYDHAEFHPPGPRRYRVEQTPAGVFHHEIMDDLDGTPIYDQAVEVKYALGSGQRGRSYLIDHDGILFQSSIGWYSTGRHWDLSPGYHPKSHSRFERRIGDGCLYCHAGRVNPAPRGADRYAQPVFAEASIGCERCHGPGEKHVARQTKSPASNGRDSTIVNPARLDHKRREAVCYQCHLQGEKVIARYGRGFFDFRPGDLLDDIWVLFVTDERVDAEGKTRAVSQVEQMRASTCYQESGERLGCISCHDPHGKPAERERVSFYQQKCNACHADRGCALPAEAREAAPEAGSCIACHMPRLSVKDVPHTAQTDHRVLRRPQPAKEEAPAAQSERFAVFDDADMRLPRREVDRARAIAIASRPGILRHPQLAAEVQDLLVPPHAVQDDPARTLDYLHDDTSGLISLGISYWAAERPADAYRAWNRVLEIDPENEMALTHLALRLHDDGERDLARGYLERFVKINPNLVEFAGRLTHVLGQSGEQKAAIAWAQKGLAIDPSLLYIREWLVEAYEREGEKELASEQREIVRRMRAALEQR